MFRNAVVAVCITLALGSITSIEASQPTKVKHHKRNNGKPVSSYIRTTPDKNRYNNYEIKGNLNPNNGEFGKRDPASVRKKR